MLYNEFLVTTSAVEYRRFMSIVQQKVRGQDIVCIADFGQIIQGSLQYFDMCEKSHVLMMFSTLAYSMTYL